MTSKVLFDLASAATPALFAQATLAIYAQHEHLCTSMHILLPASGPLHLKLPLPRVLFQFPHHLADVYLSVRSQLGISLLQRISC